MKTVVVEKRVIDEKEIDKQAVIEDPAKKEALER